MTSYPWSDSLKSLLGDLISSQKSQDLERSKADIEDKMTKILKLINEEGCHQRNSNKDSEVITLIEDLHKQYQSLHTFYDHLTRKLREVVDYKQGIYDCSTSTSSSHSASKHLSKDKASRNRKWENELQKLSKILKEELEATNREYLSSRCLTALDEMQEAEKTKDAIEIKVGQLVDARLVLEIKIVSLKEQLANLNEAPEAMQEENDFQQQHEERKAQILNLTDQIASKGGELMEVKDYLEKVKNELSMFIEDHGSFQNRISAISKNLWITKNWVSLMKSEKEMLHNKVINLDQDLSDVREKITKLKEEEVILYEGLLELKMKVEHSKKEIEEKEMQIVGKEEGKREAMAQLCLGIIDHSERCDELKELLSKMKDRDQRMT